MDKPEKFGKMQGLDQKYLWIIAGCSLFLIFTYSGFPSGAARTPLLYRTPLLAPKIVYLPSVNIAGSDRVSNKPRIHLENDPSQTSDTNVHQYNKPVGVTSKERTNAGENNIFVLNNTMHNSSSEGLNYQGKEEAKVWASMGLCYNERAHFNGKEKYPYKEVTPLALLLWKYFLPHVHTIVRIVYTDDELTIEMKDYAALLREAGALVQWVRSEGMDCVLKSQLIRIVAFEHPDVQDQDIVVTVDVNLFVMTSRILDPLNQFPNMTAWVFQYESSAKRTDGNGETFNQNLLAMRAATWRNITQYKGNLHELVQRYKTILGWNEDNSLWYTDQFITTHSLLSSGICSLPADSGLWNLAGLFHNKDLDDSKTCFHGGALRNNYVDCNIGRTWLWLQECKWWHFYPMENLARHLQKFYELTNRKISLKKYKSLYSKIFKNNKVF